MVLQARTTAEHRGAPDPEPEQGAGSLASFAIAVGGVMCGVMGKIVQDRSVLSALARGNAHWRGLAAALVDDVVLAAQETKQLWREDGLFMLVKLPVLVVGWVVPFGMFGLATQPLFNQALGVSEEDIATQTTRFHISHVLNCTLQMLVIHPYNVLLKNYVARNFPSWKVALVDRVGKGKDHFYSSWLASAAMGPVMCMCDVVRAKLLHWHKTTFFPDFMPPHRGDDEEDYDIDSDEEEVGEEEPSTARQVAHVASTALALVATCGLSAVLLTPLETIVMHMAVQPHVYGPLGTLGTVAAIYRQAGVQGFLHGLVPSIISHFCLSLMTVETEANTGHVDV